VGLPLRGIEVRILDDAGRPCVPDEIGRVALASPAAARSYHGGAAAEAFRDGWFLPGDLGRLDEAGRLYLTGRTQTFISTSVGKVDPAMVERCIAAHAEVLEVVVGVPSRAGDERAKAVVVPRNTGLTAPETAVLRRAIVAHCRDRLAEFKVPRLVEFRSEIPRSPVGKILRRELVREPGPSGSGP
jgi:long-chain acyl-CoA synthetase